MDIHQFNPLRAELFIGNLKLHKQFISFLHTDMTQVVETLPNIRQELSYST